MSMQMEKQAKSAPYSVKPSVNRIPEALLYRNCVCGSHATMGGECVECGKNRQLLQRSALHASSASTEHIEIPAIVHEVLRSPGRPLDPATLAFFEPRFGHDFSQVRVHADSIAAQSARAVSARAYTVGSNIVFGVGQYAPGSAGGLRLLTHELAHVAQGTELARTSPMAVAATREERELEARQAGGLGDHPGHFGVPLTRMDLSAASRLWRTPVDDQTRAATYPTTGERTAIQEIVNPQQQQAVAAGRSIDAVTDPGGFQTDMTDRLNDYINRALPPAQARRASSVVLNVPELTALADIAQPEVNTFYGTYLRAAVHSPAEHAARAAYHLSAHLHEVPTALTAQTDDTARDWVASQMRQQGGDLLPQYHVVSGGTAARDQALFDGVRDHIFALRTADLRTIILYHPGYEGGGEAYIQRHVAPLHAGEAPGATRRRGRWQTLATTIHEMLHAVAHEDFQTAARALEESGIAVEGFAQYFTLPVYESLTEHAARDAAFRASVEGVAAPFLRPPDARGYERYVEGVTRIRDILGGNEENLRVAFFLGRIEYLGLGGWNQSEAARRRYSANTVGAAALLTDNGQGYFRVNYGRVLLGRDAPFQLQIGGTLNYLTQGDRLGLGGTLALQYSWPQVYVRAGLDVATSTSVTQPFASSVRLDLLPGVEAGVRIGIARVGAGAFLLIPVAGGPVSERTMRLAAGVGASFEF